MAAAIRSEKRQSDEIRPLAGYTIMRRLSRRPSRVNVEIFGQRDKIGKCARFVAEQSVQLHGAIGVTEELDIGAYFKRLLAFDMLFGGSAHHYRRHAALGGRAVQA